MVPLRQACGKARSLINDRCDLLVESDCLMVAAGLMVAVTEGLKGGGFAESVAGLALQFQCLPAVAERSLVVAE